MNDQQMPQFPEPFWRESVQLPEYPKLEETIQTDVGIVGGGITGITAAYLLAKENIKVTLLDAGVLLNGTTGHTTAKITAQHGLIYDEFIQHFGLEKASQYYKATTEAKEFIESTINNYKIDCDYSKEDAYVFTNSDQYLSQLETESKAYDQLEIDGEIRDDIPLDLKVKSALVMKNQAQFHPLKYLKTLVKEAEKNGVQIFENTTAVDVEYYKHPAIITRDGHRVKCKYVIAASHFPFYDRQSFYFARMYQDRSYVLGIKTKQTFPGGMYINAEDPTRSIRATKMNGEDLWLIGGEHHKTGQGKTTIEHYNALKDFAEAKFDVTEIPFRWSAQDLTTLDKLPYIGPATEHEESVFVATGFRKWGMTNGTIAAKIISDKIVKGENEYEELYSPQRFQADPALRKFTSINADVAKHMVKGKLEFTHNSIKGLSPDDATVTRINGKRTGVYKDKEEKLYALDTTCTHMGCEVEWNSGDRTWDCPCHGSRFSYTGEVVEGPAKRPLPKIVLKETK
ncbi:FAD-dependent oxidoreductase [Ornithinibacillus sp. L9]|uniref:FAD-dependent oxidoreductase n=1 Tax=Ornithinibacillus caprae TaxID=2678566 RepID=A0A6N8FNA4_9BACI|nr:FAD-dependent oxidoreductase [Ornithinibacillus caprae]MUK90701.1 FAD-dependent oxidoreductase [Ornithinibacillus caprae]